MENTQKTGISLRKELSIVVNIGIELRHIAGKVSGKRSLYLSFTETCANISVEVGQC